MKRRDFIKVTGIGAVGAATLAAPAIAQSRPELKWRCLLREIVLTDDIFLMATPITSGAARL